MSTSATVVTATAPASQVLPWRSAVLPGSALVHDFVPPAATVRVTTAEREAYDRGVADGQRRTAEQHQAAIAAQVSRLTSAIAEVSALRPGVLHRANHDVVVLALELARCILKREVRLDPTLLAGLGTAAAARLSASGVATIEMSPDLFHPVKDSGAIETGPVVLVENSQLFPGSCVVRSSAGAVNLSIDAQIQEMFDALLDPAGNDASL